MNCSLWQTFNIDGAVCMVMKGDSYVYTGSCLVQFLLLSELHVKHALDLRAEDIQ